MRVRVGIFGSAAGRLMPEAQADSGPIADEDEGSTAESDEAVSANQRPLAVHDARKRTCPELKRNLTMIRNQQRVGTSASTTAKLNESRRGLEAALRSEGC